MEPMDRIDKATLVLYLNLGGEMIYVLQQRLSAQKVAQDKSGRVLQEVIGCLLCPNQMGKLECAMFPCKLSFRTEISDSGSLAEMHSCVQYVLVFYNSSPDVYCQLWR